MLIVFDSLVLTTYVNHSIYLFLENIRTDTTDVMQVIMIMKAVPLGGGPSIPLRLDWLI